MKNLVVTILSVFLSMTSYAISPITGTTNVCVGNTTTLSDATIGGTWSSSATLIATIGSLTGIVTGITAGTVTITYTVGTSNVTAALTVNPLPAPITGTLYLCVGGVTLLHDLTPSGTWSSSNPSVASFTSGSIVLGMSAGTSVISYILGTGCSTTAIVTVDPMPSPISGSTNLCLGDTVTMLDVAVGGIWSSSNPAVGSISSSSGLLTGISVGTTVISYSDPSGCPGSDTINVVNSPTPITGATTICTGLTTTLLDTSSGGTWSSSTISIAIVGSVSGVVSGISAGVDTIYYTFLSSGCKTSVLVTVDPLPCSSTGVNEVPKDRTNIFPNPFIDQLNIIGLEQSTNYLLFSITGMFVSQGTLQQGSNTIHMQRFSAGIYILELTDGKGKRSIVRVIKEK